MPFISVKYKISVVTTVFSMDKISVVITVFILDKISVITTGFSLNIYTWSTQIRYRNIKRRENIKYT